MLLEHRLSVDATDTIDPRSIHASEYTAQYIESAIAEFLGQMGQQVG
jgi:hypothetical protein